MLVSGASSGIGKATCQRLAAKGYRVYGGSRSQPGATQWSEVVLDVCDDASTDAAVQEVLVREGRLDALVHCAGISVAGSIEDVTASEAQHQFETNYFGTVRMVRAVLPAMRGARAGRILVIGSIGGLIGLPFLGHYSASKFAIDGFMQALRMEIKPFGIDATVVHPGDFSTAIADRQLCGVNTGSQSAYGAFQATIDRYEKAVKDGRSPDIVAAAIEGLLRRRHLPVRRIVGSPMERVAVRLRSVLPSRAFEFIIRKNYGL